MCCALHTQPCYLVFFRHEGHRTSLGALERCIEKTAEEQWVITFEKELEEKEMAEQGLLGLQMKFQLTTDQTTESEVNETEVKDTEVASLDVVQVEMMRASDEDWESGGEVEMVRSEVDEDAVDGEEVTWVENWRECHFSVICT